MPARFYAPDARVSGDLIVLPEDEAEHLSRVLRLKPGEPVIVFNGRGHAFEAVIESAKKNTVQIAVGAPADAAPEPQIAITLVQGVLKGAGMDDVVRDAVMIGVAAIQPIVTARTEATLASIQQGRRQDRWQRIAISSAKQCRRAVVPPVLAPRPFEALAGLIDQRRLSSPALMLVEPGVSDAISLGDVDLSAPKECSVLVGPEGGWSPDEIVMASAACRLVTVGGRTIRADAMALVASAALFSKWGEY